MKLLKLFEPGKIGNLEVKNRIVMPPMGTYTGKDGYVTDAQIRYYEARAKGGVGLIVIEGVPILPETRLFPQFLAIHDDIYIPTLRKLATSIKAHGPAVFCQLLHFGARASEFRSDIQGVAPSAITHPLFKTVPKELSKDEIRFLVEAFGEAARRAIEAGFDGVHIHGAHGYLINQFLSPWTNKRTDEYGGNVENRTRFACEIIREIRERIGPEFPIIFRMDGYDGFEGGVGIDDAVLQSARLVEAGADALDVSAGAREGLHWQFPCLVQPSGVLTKFAAAIKKVVPVPVITVGKIGTPALAERILREGKADFVDMGRALIADPELPLKAKEGRIRDIRPCVYDNACREHRWAKGQGMEPTGQVCTVNARCGREADYKPHPASVIKKVMVIGGGLAGMEAARTLSERGHQVSLYEKGLRLGGQWNILSAYRPEAAALTRYLSRGMRKAKVRVFLNREIDRAAIETIKPDSVVMATGAIPILPDIAGIKGKNVVQANEVLSGAVKVGREVVIIGGRLVGLDTACFLAKRCKRVSVVTRSAIGRGVGVVTKLALREYLVKYGVYLYPNSVPINISQKGVNINNDGEIMFLKADTVVIAVGSKSENSMAGRLKGLVPEVYTIGDCVEPRDGFSAIHEGARVGEEI